MPFSSRPARILLVEDSEDDAFFFRWTLQKSSVPNELIHLADGNTALDHLKGVAAGTTPRPDIVFLDLKLPSFSGFEILEWVRQQAWTEPLHILVLSGSEHAGDITRSESLGAAGYLVKPIAVEQLKARLASTPVVAATPDV
jgi:DNA-binding response OmpR family regulator